MSIIHDALKKVEQAQNIKIQQAIIPENAARGSKKRNFLLICLSIVIGLFSLNFLIKHSPDKASSKVIQPLQTEVKIDSPNEPVLKKDNPAPAVLVLNGVFLADNEWCALINNQIVKKGEIINGATLKSINFQEVELDSNGSIVKLSNQEK